jgi:hypothetical protein
MLRNLFEIQESAAAAAAERERENLFCNWTQGHLARQHRSSMVVLYIVLMYITMHAFVPVSYSRGWSRRLFGRCSWEYQSRNCISRQVFSSCKQIPVLCPIYATAAYFTLPVVVIICQLSCHCRYWLHGKFTCEDAVCTGSIFKASALATIRTTSLSTSYTQK